MGVDIDLGKRVAFLRKKNNLSQKEVAQGIISVSHLSNLEVGRFSASEDTLKFLAKRLSVNESYLLHIKEINTPLENKLLELNDLLIVNIEKLDELIAAIPKVINNIYLEISYQLIKASYYWKRGENSQAKKIYEHYLKYYKDDLEETIKDQPLVLQTAFHYYQGIKLYRENKYKESLIHFIQLIPLSTKDTVKANLYYNVSLIYHRLMKNIEAINQALKAQELYMEQNNWLMLAEVYNLLGVIYLEEGGLQTSTGYLLKAFDIAKTIHSNNLI
ncbi:helix-turn-helix domain-containing protein [Bacillus gobiensis]